MKNIFKALKRILNPIEEVIVEVVYAITFFLESNLYNFGLLIEIGTPYIMWYIGIITFQERGVFAVGGELFLPIGLMTIASILKKSANKRGKGYQVPVARKRFTSEDEYGEISIAEEDIQEIIIYLNDIENYIEKRGLNRWD
jgi:hypothetical protein